MSFLAIPGVAGAMVSGASSLLGGLLGRKSKTQSTRINFQQLRDDAQAAGFNPLTALKATGGGGNTTTTHGGLSSMEVIGNAIQDGLGTFLSFDPVAEETKRLENELLAQQVKRYKSGEPGWVEGTTTTASPVRNQDDAIPQYVTVYNNVTGEYQRMLNPTLMIGDPMEIGATLTNLETHKRKEPELPMDPAIPVLGRMGERPPARFSIWPQPFRVPSK